MSIPTALVKVEILAIRGIPPASLTPGHIRYARATFETGSAPAVVTGRSRPIPDAGGDLDTTQEGTPWQYEVRVDTTAKIRISVDFCEDRGHDAPPEPVNIFHSISAPWASGIQTLGANPSLEVRVTRTFLNSTERATLARAHGPANVSGTLAIPQGILVAFTAIDGLYPPENEAGSRNVPGYISEDNLGRIFTNRRPDGSWAHDNQFIDVYVKVTAFGGATLTPGLQLNWTIIDGDDPSNDGPEMHREWGQYVDPNDYDSSGSPAGANAADNAAAFSAGNGDADRLFSVSTKGTKRWAEAPSGPPPTALSRETAQTTVQVISPTSARCSVRIHCPNVAGTNFILKAELSVPDATPVFAATTGVMTMWKRLDVEVVRMESAHSIDAAVSNVPKFFLPAFVQLDFHPERVVNGALDKAEMTPHERLEMEATRAWINHPKVFSRQREPGWFFLGAARRASRLPGGANPPNLFDGHEYTLGFDLSRTRFASWVEVEGEFREASLVTFFWIDPSAGPLRGMFPVAKTKPRKGRTKLILGANDVVPDFTGHDSDGSTDHAIKTSIYFYPQHQYSLATSTLSPGGLGVPSTGARLVVHAPGASASRGISPLQPDAKTGAGQFFAGRTVLFTHAPSLSQNGNPTSGFADEVVHTAIHEFLHAFGMPHKCGHFNWRTPRLKSCCMNYFLTWLVDSSRNPIPGSEDIGGKDMCGRHAMEVRRVHLEKNKGLNW
jgi:hypothetical protein